MSSKVSIITANYNKKTFLSETINSLLAQNYTNWELIFVDDHSTDGSFEFVRSEFKDKRIKCFKLEECSGANVCRNYGLKEATGEYIVFLDSDDLLTPGCLETRVNKMEQDPGLHMCVFAMGNFHRTIGDDTHVWRPRTKNALIDFLQHHLPWSILQPIWKKEVLVSSGGFDISFGRLQDVEFHTRLLFEEQLNFKQFPEIIDCYYRVGDDRRSANTFDYNMPRVIGSLQYYSKFFDQAERKHLSAKLLGTIYQTYHQCIFHTRYGKMTKEQFLVLEARLIDTNILKLNGLKQTALRFSRFYNFHMPRIPGINHILGKIITN